MSKKHFEVIFCVFGCPTIQKYKEEILKICSTWGKSAKTEDYKVLFFLGEELSSLIGDDYIYLKGVNNDYFSASYKQNLGLKYIFDNFTFNYVYVCGTDTFVNIKFLKQYITKFDSNEQLCIGGHGDYRTVQEKQIYYHSGGPGFLITYSAICKIQYLLDDMVELWVMIVQKQNLYTACDLALCFFLNYTGCKFVIDDEVFFHCNHKGYPCHMNKETKKDVVAYHNMSLSDFDEYFDFIQENEIHHSDFIQENEIHHSDFIQEDENHHSDSIQEHEMSEHLF
jgi:hypothetical protein